MIDLGNIDHNYLMGILFWQNIIIIVLLTVVILLMVRHRLKLPRLPERKKETSKQEKNELTLEGLGKKKKRQKE